MKPLRPIISAACTDLILPGCRQQDHQLTPADVTGVWTLQESSLRSDDYTRDDLDGFEVRVNDDASFTATSVPPGLFLNHTRDRLQLSGTWALAHKDGSNHVTFTIEDLPGYTSGTYGRPIDWKDGERVIRLSEADGFAYLRKSR